MGLTDRKQLLDNVHVEANGFRRKQNGFQTWRTQMAFKQPNGNQVAKARLALDMTQVQFAEWLYVSDRQVRNWENDTTPIPPLAWEKVQAALAEVAK